MKLPRFTATQAARGSGAVRANPAEMTQEFQGLRNIGGALGQASDAMFHIENRRIELDAQIQYGKVTQNIDAFLKQQTEELSQTEIASKEDHDAILKDRHNKLDKFIADQMGSVKNQRARKRLDGWKTVNTMEVDGQRRFIPFDEVRGEARRRWNDYQTGSMISLAEAAAQSGDIETSLDYIDQMDKTELISKERAEGLKQQMRAVVQKAADQQAVKTVESYLVGMGDWQQAQEWLEDPKNASTLLKEYGYQIKDVKSLLDDMKGFAATEANKATVQHEKVWAEQSGSFEKDAMDALLKGDYESVKAMIDVFNTDLPGEYQGKAANLKNTYKGRLDSELDRQARNVEKQEKIQTNEMVRAAIGTIATDIWRGAATKAEFDEVLNNARYGKMVDGTLKYTFDRLMSDKPLIDDADYRSLSTAADTELKSAQAEFVRQSVQSASDVIVGVDAGRFRRDDQGRLIIDDNAMDNILDQQKATKLKERLNAVNRYETTLREWIAANPTATPKEARIYAEQLKYEYWDMSQEQIEAANRDRREFIKIPRPTTREEAAKLPSGTEFIAPNGERKVVP